MNYQRFKQIVLRMIRIEGLTVISIFEVQTEMGVIDSMHDDAIRFQEEFPQYEGYLKPRSPQPNRARAMRSYRSLAFEWLRKNWTSFLTLEAVVLTTTDRVNMKRSMRLAGITEYNDHIVPTLRRLLLKRNPILKGRVKILHRTISGMEVAA